MGSCGGAAPCAGSAAAALKEREEELAVLAERNRMLETERDGLVRCLTDNYNKVESVVPALLPPHWVTENGLSAAQAVESLENILVKERKLRHEAEARTRSLEQRLRQMERAHMSLIERYTATALVRPAPPPATATAATQVSYENVPTQSPSSGLGSLCSELRESVTAAEDGGSPLAQPSLLSTSPVSSLPQALRTVALQTDALSRQVTSTQEYISVEDIADARGRGSTVASANAASQTEGPASPDASPVCETLSAVSTLASFRSAAGTPADLALERSRSAGQALPRRVGSSLRLSSGSSGSGPRWR